MRCQNERSNKEYIVTITRNADGYHTIGYYGPVGNATKAAPQGVFATLPEAEKAAEKVIRAKTVGKSAGERYTIVQGAVSQAIAAAQTDAAPTGIEPQLLTPISEESIATYVLNPQWVFQEKFDGERLLVQCAEDGTLVPVNRRGIRTNIPATLHQALTDLLPRGVLVDGERVGERYYCFDLLAHPARPEIQCEPYERRYALLRDLLPAHAQVQVAETAFDITAKRALFARAHAEHWEGVVVKDRDAGYTPGRPADGGPQRKCKFWKSASCLVIGHNAKSSIQVGLLDGANTRNVGNVTVKANQTKPALGAVVEVRYLYVGAGGSLYQPELLGVRTDLARDACTIAQLSLPPAA